MKRCKMKNSNVLAVLSAILALGLPRAGIAEELVFLISSMDLNPLVYEAKTLSVFDLPLEEGLRGRELLQATLELKYEAASESESEYSEFQVARWRNEQAEIPGGRNHFVADISRDREPRTVRLNLMPILRSAWAEEPAAAITLILGSVGRESLGLVELLPLEAEQDVWCKVELVVD
jgi:hypothetical protein